MNEVDNLLHHLERISHEISILQGKADALDIIQFRAKDAHDYAQKYLMPQAWGENVWHTILEDAIRLRKEKDGA